MAHSLHIIIYFIYTLLFLCFFSLFVFLQQCARVFALCACAFDYKMQQFAMINSFSRGTNLQQYLLVYIPCCVLLHGLFVAHPILPSYTPYTPLLLSMLIPILLHLPQARGKDSAVGLLLLNSLPPSFVFLPFHAQFEKVSLVS